MITTDIYASILTDHMMLEATEQGLGTVWICYFNAEVLKKELELPDNLEPINILVVGYRAEPEADINRHNTQRIPIEKLVTYL